MRRLGLLSFFVGLFHLVEFQIHRSVAAEDADGDPQLALFVIDFFHHADLAVERTIVDLDGIPHFEGDLRGDIVFPLAHLQQHRFHFLWAHGGGLVLRARKINDPLGVLDEIPSLVHHRAIRTEQIHVHQEVTGEILPLRLGLLAVLEFGHTLLRHENFEDDITHLLSLHTTSQILTDLVFLAREDMNDIPLIALTRNSCHDVWGWKFGG